MTVRFAFDVISPYAYLAWQVLPDLAARHGRAVEPVPVLLAALLEAHGTKGPAEVPAKRAWVFDDVLRHAVGLGVPFEPPQAHPFNPLLALRVASLPMPPDVRARLVGALFHATWGSGEGVTDPAVVGRLAAEAGYPGDAVADAQSAEAKDRVRAQTAQALADGAFGVPTLWVDGARFWGFDSLGHVARRLAGADPLDTPEARAAAARWAALPVGAARRGP